MRNSKSVRVYTFVFVLTLILLLSSTIGTTLWAKPDKPGKPSRPETENFEAIKYGNGRI